ncbi:unnamed protein product [Linum tenue]|uniref:DUF4283 domain-containing protein n=1 Tax=Linum tenue TaxID=586396 RepID=A0AAV0MCV5_9ROSI|nr:unnamed protein product [Linum tenue]
MEQNALSSVLEKPYRFLLRLSSLILAGISMAEIRRNTTSNRRPIQGKEAIQAEIIGRWGREEGVCVEGEDPEGELFAQDWEFSEKNGKLWQYTQIRRWDEIAKKKRGIISNQESVVDTVMRLAPKWVYITTDRRLDPATESLQNTEKGKLIPEELGIPSEREPMDVDQIVEFELVDVEDSMRRAKLSLIGRLFMENPPSLKTIQKIVQGEWGCSGNVTVIEAELGVLQFLFDDERDKDWVL